MRPDYRNYLAVRFFTGMRSGGINGLQWKYIDLKLNRVLVRGTLVDGEVEDEAKTKTQSSIRGILMQPMVREAIDAQLKARDPEDPWVFPMRAGGSIDGHNFTNRVWYPLLRYLELDKRRPYPPRVPSRCLRQGPKQRARHPMKHESALGHWRVVPTAIVWPR